MKKIFSILIDGIFGLIIGFSLNLVFVIFIVVPLRLYTGKSSLFPITQETSVEDIILLLFFILPIIICLVKGIRNYKSQESKETINTKI